VRALALVAALLVPGLAHAQQQVSLWPNGAPGFESRKAIPEQAADYWVKSVNDPSVTVFLPPKDVANGAALVVLPGGGHRLLVFNAEGRDVATVMNPKGVAVFVVKYRLFREEGSPYTIDHARQDAVRAVRYVRAHAAEYGIDPKRIGLMGFSAGGETVNLEVYQGGAKDPKLDAIDQVSARPDFQVLVYPGPLGVPDKVPSDTPPAFMIAANDDECCSAPLVDLLPKFRAAKVPVELHLFQAGGHAFNMGLRKEQASFKHWPNLLVDWLGDNGWLKGR
jgi:acetyl esterase/lipase